MRAAAVCPQKQDAHEVQSIPLKKHFFVDAPTEHTKGEIRYASKNGCQSCADAQNGDPGI